ncbi:MAG: hypothetical protein RI564_13375, partial [Gracilimonas sp.]|nr:hypothetical protein [Gracilimonas sp.]
GDLDNHYGITFSPEVPVAEQVEYMTKLWKDAGEFEKKAEQLFQKVKAEHTWQKIFHQYRTHIHGLLKTEMAY